MTERRGSRREPGTVPPLEQILTDLPALSGAACIGRHELFDLAVHPEDRRADNTLVQAEAARLCGACPHATSCPDSLTGTADRVSTPISPHTRKATA